MKRPEQQLQIACANYLRLMLPKDAFFTSVPAGGGGARRGAFIKAMGYRAGTPDMFILYDNFFYAIEFKAPGKSATPVQKEVATNIIVAGGSVAVVRSLDDLQTFLKRWGIPMRFKVAA